MLASAPLALADTAANSTTGAGSENVATTQVNNSTDISSSNTAIITNNLSITANTGNNEANGNTGGGEITTGDIHGSVTINNSVNSSGIAVPLCCDPDSNASNSTTGADSENVSRVEVSNNIDINQDNWMRIRNNLDLDLNTGGNEANDNTGIGSINTGDIDFTIDIDNSGNNNSVNGPGNPNPGTNPGPNPGPGVPPGSVLGASDGLPVTGGSLPIAQIVTMIMAGLLLRSYERELRERFLNH